MPPHRTSSRKNRPRTYAVIGYATCAECDSLYVVRRAARPQDRCCRRVKCRRSANARRLREFQRKWTAEHGQPFTARYRQKRRVDNRRAVAEGRGPRTRLSGAAQAADERRAEWLKAQYVEPVSRRAVFERDGYVCGICLELVDPSLRFPDPGSATIDHEIPLALGGEHSMANARCAHLACNVRRGTRTDEEYLASDSSGIQTAACV